MDLEFRKFLMQYGITNEEYEKMSTEEKEELQNRYNQAIKNQRIAQKSENMKAVGQGMQSLGCLIILVPVLAILLFFIWGILTS